MSTQSKRLYLTTRVVPNHMRETILEENQSGSTAGHFAGEILYRMLSHHWWWAGMYCGTVKHCSSCPQCAIVNSSGHVNRPPLCPIPVQRAFQIVGVDIMELLKTEAGNRYVVVFQDFLTKFPLVFTVPDQKTIRIARLLAEELVPLFGVPEALLSDRGTKLISHLMKDLCKLLRMQKLNTTAYHPMCNGMVERFNRTLKTALRKHAPRFGSQWDRYLYGVLWAYRNTPHESTKEKPSFLLYGMDLRTPTEAAFLPCSKPIPAEVSDYREGLILSLTSARELAAANIRKTQKKYKTSFDKKCTKDVPYRVGDWVMVYYPQDESGTNRKLSRPWHGPFCISAAEKPNVCVTKVYIPKDDAIRVHVSRVKRCPPTFPGGFYWYGGWRSRPGRPPKWVSTMLERMTAEDPQDDNPIENSAPSEVEGSSDTLESGDTATEDAGRRELD